MKPIYTILISCFLFNSVLAQQQEFDLPAEKYLDQLKEKADGTGKKIRKQKEKYLSRLKVFEQKILRSAKKDSQTLISFDSLFRPDSLIYSYDGTGNYLPHLDSLRTAVKFLGSFSENTENKLNELGTAYKDLQSEFLLAEKTAHLLKDRYKQLLEMGDHRQVSKILRKYNCQLLYFQAHINEFKSLFEDASRAEEKLLELAMKVPGFREFFSKHSQLASLFAMPEPGQTVLPEGLQTRNSVRGLLSRRFGSNASAGELMKEKMLSAQSGLNALKNRFQSYVTHTQNGYDGELTLNSQKTKSFGKRLQPEYNFQSVRARQMFPTSSDISFSLGYKINDRLISGFGLSCRIGWGNNWDKIVITHQGFGFRSFTDWQISRKNRSMMFSGGYEKNRNRLSASGDIPVWQQHVLIGFTRYQEMNLGQKKVKAVFRLYWNILSHKDALTQPVVFRIGYAFN